MVERDKRWKARALIFGALGGGALLAVVLALGSRGLGPGRDPGEAAGFRGFTAGSVPAGAAAPAPKPETPEEVAREVAEAVASWRGAVLAKDADTVVKLDAAFRAAPARYLDALVESAKKDPNERVRAFSARVLGKLRQVELTQTFERLLEDGSPFVRQNAAWALGELGSGTIPPAAARHALAELRHVRARDPAGDVRTAARDAIDRLE
jgi:hypothetical protein